MDFVTLPTPISTTIITEVRRTTARTPRSLKVRPLTRARDRSPWRKWRACSLSMKS